MTIAANGIYPTIDDDLMVKLSVIANVNFIIFLSKIFGLRLR